MNRCAVAGLERVRECLHFVVVDPTVQDFVRIVVEALLVVVVAAVAAVVAMVVDVIRSCEASYFYFPLYQLNLHLSYVTTARIVDVHL